MPTSTVSETISVASGNQDGIKGHPHTHPVTPDRYVPGGKIPNLGKWILRQVTQLFLILLIDLGIPLALYYGLHNVIAIVYALVISGIPPFLWVIYGFIRKRTIDVLGCIIGGSFILSGILSLITGDARIAILRESILTGVVGTSFLISMLPIKTRWFSLRPIAYTFLRQMVFSEASYRWIDKDGEQQTRNVADWQWEHVRVFRISMYAQTGFWGILLVMELVAVIIMINTLPDIEKIIAYNNIITSVVVALQIATALVAGFIVHRFATRVGAEWSKENDFTDYYHNLESQGNDSNGQPLAAPAENGDRAHHSSDNMA